MNNIEQLKFPIGPCKYQDVYSEEDIKRMILDIETFPLRLEQVAQHLTEEQLQTSYREGGWTLNQVIHHCADSHMNMLIRLKLTLSESGVTIKPYQEDLWAEMVDYTLPFNNSMTLLHAVHKKITVLLKNCNNEDLEKIYLHPQYNRSFRLADMICLYAWHGNHHLAQINLVAKP